MGKDSESRAEPIIPEELQPIYETLGQQWSAAMAQNPMTGPSAWYEDIGSDLFGGSPTGSSGTARRPRSRYTTDPLRTWGVYDSGEEEVIPEENFQGRDDIIDVTVPGGDNNGGGGGGWDFQNQQQPAPLGALVAKTQFPSGLGSDASVGSMIANMLGGQRRPVGASRAGIPNDLEDSVRRSALKRRLPQSRRGKRPL